MNLNEVQSQGEVPPNMRGLYTLRVKDATFKLSKSSGNKMIELNLEIIDPQTFTDDKGKSYDLTSLQFLNHYLVLTDKGAANVKRFHEIMGLPMEIDDDQPETAYYIDLCFEAILDSKERFAMSGDKPITDREGNPVSQGFQVNINTILRKVDNPGGF